MKLEFNWLVSSQTVADIQRFFGLERLDTEKTLHLNSQTPESNGHTASATNDVHKRKAPSQSIDDTTNTETSTKDELRYTVKNQFWYWIFAFGATLGDDIFYYTFYPFWFYNLSPWVIRRVMLMWGLIMYVGQSSKEILRWPRPSDPPAVRIEKRYFQEYGMPSTHAMVGTLVPFTILAVTWDHYEYSHAWGIALASAYTLLVCFSRLYRGMHYILDVLVGVNVTFVILGLVLPFIDYVDFFLLTNPFAPVVMVTVALVALYFHPCHEKWNDARADTTIIIAVVNGVYISSWIMCQVSALEDVLAPIPTEIQWPGLSAIPIMFVRELIGTSIMVVVHLVVRAFMLKLLSIILGRKVDRNGKKEIIIEFPYKYVSYLAVGASAFVCIPIFPILGI